ERLIMKIALVAMPWPQFDAPSAALGILSAYLKKTHPEWQVDCKHPYINMWQMTESIYERISNNQTVEFLFIPQIFPEQTNAVQPYFNKLLADHLNIPNEDEKEKQLKQLYDNFLKASEHIVDETVKALANNYDLVGFSITYAQLFSSIAVAQKLKKASPNTKIVFGGAGVEGDCGYSIIKEFSCIDYIVQGEGEIPFLKLTEALSNDQKDVNIPCVLTRTNTTKPVGHFSFTCEERMKNQINDLSLLPTPDYDDYHKLAEELNLYWQIPIETSRGCWWNNCYFCNLNIGSYREKRPERVAKEISALTRKYKNLRLKFMDNVMRKKGLNDMIDAIKELKIDLRFITEVRASIHPSELLALWEAGCNMLQIGIEGFSSAYLKRMGKGSSTILNLQALKTCCELGITSASNVLVKFPGATQEEVHENAYNMEHYAIAYEPTELSEFCLYVNSPVCAQVNDFGITNIRNSHDFLNVLPKEVVKNLKIFWQDYNSDSKADWAAVYAVRDKWKALRNSLQKIKTRTDHPLFYTDGSSFLEIVDRRDGFRLILLEDEWYDIYMYAMEIRSYKNILAYMKNRCDETKVKEILEACVTEKLMFTERGQYLSLATAVSPLMAARRIRQAKEK
ncbi:RiPP maturation radical SAM C-methyltransferase, partial [bacterium]|nr:RiPP maturation radical SAM C-methyltransferase [bacterium]